MYDSPFLEFIFWPFAPAHPPINFSLASVIPSTQVVKLGKNIPVVDGAFVASSATIVGKVHIAKGASIWYGAVLRGEMIF